MDQIRNSNITVNEAQVDVVNLQFNTPVHLPFGVIESRPSSWLKISGEVDGKRIDGAAEGTALPFPIPLYDDEAANLKQNILHIVDSVKGSNYSFDEMREIIKTVQLGGNFATARFTVESALIDMIARSHNTSVAQLIMERDVNELNIPFGKSIAESTKDAVIQAFESARESGASRFKFKISPQTFDEIYDGIRALSLNSDTQVMVDANGMFDPGNNDHIAMIKKLDKLDLLTIEEPVSRAGSTQGLDAYRLLHEQITLHTPLTIDDAIKTVEDAHAAIHDNLGEIINLKPGRLGSFLDCISIAGLAKTLDKQVMVGGMFEATPGRMATLTLAAYCHELGFTIPGDVSLPSERLGEDLVESTLFLNTSGEVVFRPRTGWGYDI